MKSFEKIALIIIFMLKFIFNKDGIITLPFEKEIPNLKDVEPEKVIYPSLAHNIIMAEIRVGSSPQTMKLRLEFENYVFYIASKSSLSDIKFDETKSETYQKIQDEEINFGYSKLKMAVFSSDYIYYEKNRNTKYETKFLLGTSTDQDKAGGLIGLNLEDVAQIKDLNNYNFLNELKRIGIIKDYYFTIKYTDKNKGNIILGDLPHNYDNNYNEKNYLQTYADFSENDLTWKIKFEIVYIAEKENSFNRTEVEQFAYGYFRIEKNIIEGTEKYRQQLLSTFMQEQIDKNLCFELASDIYYSYYCKKEADISKMQNIYFYNKDIDTLELTYKDLFYYNEYDGYQYFLVVFSTDTEDQDGFNKFWILGEPFFKKYQFIFNKDSKSIGRYTSIDNKNIEESWLKRNKVYIILIVILVIMFLVIGVLIIIILNKKPSRKKKANELDDEFEYSSDNNQNKLVND